MVALFAEHLTNVLRRPFTMTVQSIKVTDGSTNTSSYVYGDQTGDYASIKAVAGESAAYTVLNKQSTVQSAQQKWDGLSTGEKVGIACGVVGFFAIGLIAFTAFCIVQRRAGRRERAVADNAWDQNNAELMEYKTTMAKGGFAVSHIGHGEKF